jgi:hypothetical protein
VPAAGIDEAANRRLDGWSVRQITKVERLPAHNARSKNRDGSVTRLPHLALALVRVQRLARQAHLEQRGSRQEVKAIELEAANGQPRTICTGTNFHIDLPSWAADVLRRSEVESAALGCLKIFRDTTRANGGGNYWRSWCADCAPNTGHKLRWWRTEISRRQTDYATQILKRRRESA